MKRDHLEFLCDVSELSSALVGSSGIDSFLEQLVGLVARHLQAHVCSIYLYDPTTRELEMQANVGLMGVSGGKIRLALGEGLVGTVLADGAPLLDNHASQNPLYKFFANTGEEQYDSFLAVPLLKGENKIGVLAVQREERDHFHNEDISALRVVAGQLVGCIENAQALLKLNTTQPAPVHSTGFVKGRAVSPGGGLGPARVLRTSESLQQITTNLDTNLTLPQFRRAVELTALQIEELQLRMARKLPETVSLIFSAHVLMLKDVGFVEKMARQIELGKPVGKALFDVAQSYIDAFGKSETVHLREKSHDVEDLAVRLAKNLRGQTQTHDELNGAEVLIARNVYPSELVMLSLEEPVGIVLVGGGATTHVSILARSLGLPLFIADAPSLCLIEQGTPILLDGHTGNIYVDPSHEVIDKFTAQRRIAASLQASSRRPRETTTTRDGTRVRLLANINLLSEMPVAREMRAEGIGLYRTEFPFMIRASFPDEEEQFLVYRQLVQGAEGKPVTFRTLDVGGDKTLSYFDHGNEQNPELGLRGIRFTLRHRDVFQQQVRAILRAGADTQELRVMFPMISSLDELRQARGIVESCLDQLQQRRIPHHSSPRIGMMVELPAVLETAEEFSREAEFFSIGSNDFVQYMLAADRGNENVADCYCPHHPAVLRGISRLVRAAHEQERLVTVCGEMAHDPVYVPFLLGIGVRDLSVVPHRIGEIQEFIQSIDVHAAEREADMLLREFTVAGVEARLELLLIRTENKVVQTGWLGSSAASPQQ